MPKYYEFKVAGYTCILLLFVLWNVCTSTPATES